MHKVSSPLHAMLSRDKIAQARARQGI